MFRDELIEALTAKRWSEGGDEVVICVGDKEYTVTEVTSEPADRSVGIMSGALFLGCIERKEPS